LGFAVAGSHSPNVSISHFMNKKHRAETPAEADDDGLRRYLAPSAPLAAALARYDATLERLRKHGRIRLPQRRTKKEARQ
jgi:hypothetical protein